MSAFDRFFPILAWRRGRTLADGFEAPIRAEVLGAAGLEDYARTLAQTDSLLAKSRHGQPLLDRFHRNRRALLAAQQRFAADARANRALPPAAEWLLDNFYIVQTHLHQVERDLSRGFYQELPKLAAGLHARVPRVYGLVLELVAHTDSRLDLPTLTSFVAAYQSVQPLTTGELWAVPIMARLSLIENLRRLVGQALVAHDKRGQADRWANQLLHAAGGPPPQLVATVADLARGQSALDSIFVVQLLERLRDQTPAIAPAVQWLEDWLGTHGSSLEAITRIEHQRRAANRVSVGNTIASLRGLAAIDWAEFFEASSALEVELRRDPLGLYAAMDFDTRDRYRHVVEKLSKRAHRPEMEVATAANRLAAAAPADPADDRRRHNGYYLLSAGRPALEAAVGYRPFVGDTLRRALKPLATPVFLGAILLLTALLTAVPVRYAAQHGLGLAGLLGLALLAGLPASALAVAAVNWSITILLPPHRLPKLNFTSSTSGGIPPTARTLVVVPCLISDLAGIERLFDNLEVRFLANRDAHLHFALLGDFADSAEAERPEDAALIAAAARRVEELNAQYGRGRADRFYFFNRRRTWNAHQGVWMGWERKRGKLLEFNRLLRGAVNTNYVTQLGDLALLPHVQYVITLDADTDLPLRSAARLVGAMAHPLNHPRLDARRQLVVEGYGMLQPRVAVNALAASETRFSRLFAGDGGLDPYSTAISTVYQDLFGSGNYIGKAIYSVDACLAVLDGTFAENQLLSHDLLEGSYARAGQLTDVQLLEDFPSGYDAYAQRQHRWIRGDWQIAEWVLPWVTGPAGRPIGNPLPLIARWKFLDNLRVSVVPLAATLLMILGWTVLPGRPLFWTVAALLPIMLPEFTGLVLNSGVHPVGEPWLAYLRNVWRDAFLGLSRALYLMALLLFEAGNNLDAIGRVFVRRFITRRHLLEWNSAAMVEHGQARTRRDYWARLAASPAVAAGLLLLVAFTRPAALLDALPLLLLWAAAPLLAHWISQPAVQPRNRPLPAAARQALRLTARRIWRFYETFAGATDHWLPPDNYQEEPSAQVAHRTSPTNIGFLLLSALAAYDFGYLDAVALTTWFERVLATLHGMERYRGHLFNWHDTLTLKPLAPEYISTVDSGNLAACLLVIKQACAEISAGPVLAPAALPGLEDTFAGLRAALAAWRPADATAHAARQVLQNTEDRLVARLAAAGPWAALLADLEPLAESLAHTIHSLDAGAGPADPTELRYWSEACLSLVQLRRQALTDLALTDAVSPPTWATLAAAPEHPLAADLVARLAAVAQAAEAFVGQIDFTFLFRPERGLFSIGYTVPTQKLDVSEYDLLASESRLGSLVAIARGQVSSRHWFRLGRPLTWAGGSLAVLSWGGTMFEYLMPGLLLYERDRTLLAQTALAVISAQRQYAAAQRVPWGISESGYYAFDYQFAYQYQSFGVPGLGLKRDLGENLVIAPYATLLALPLNPSAAYANLQHLAAEGLSGAYGYYEAIDYTPARRPRGQKAGIVRSYMAHHQGMSLVALDNALNGAPMPRRFHAEPAIAAVELLLQERLPRHVALLEPHPAADSVDQRDLLERVRGVAPDQPPSPNRWYGTPHTPAPRTQVLSNGAYEVMVSNAGSGYSAHQAPGAGPSEALALTRWRPDATCDQWGSFIYIQDTVSHQAWSAGYQPTAREAEQYEVIFALDRAHFMRRDLGIETRLDVVVSPRDPVELRRLTLTNLSRQTRTLAVTSYAEVALDTVAADLAHPAFSKLFVESERVPDQSVLLFHRRPRASGQTPPWALHMLTAAEPLLGPVEHETDRARFIGRGRTPRDPLALLGPLSGTTGAVLDPIMSLRGHLRLAPGESAELTFVTGLADTRAAALALAGKFSEGRALEDAYDLAWVYSQIQLRHLNIEAAEAHLFQRLGARILYPAAALRAPDDILLQNTRGQNGLWAYGLSGDHPLLVLRVDEAGELDLVRQLLHAHEYWRLNNFTVDLVILNEHPTTYAEGLQAQLQGLMDTSLSRPWQDKPGGVFIRRADHMPLVDRVLLLTAARVVLDGGLGTLAEQLGQPVPAKAQPEPRLRPRALPVPVPAAAPPVAPLDFDNGLGGFTPDGHEYVITLTPGQWTPAPWINVLANERFGCLVSESGLGYTWSENSQQNRLTPWSNDPVSDPPGEVLYLRDDDTGAVWTPTPLPIREPTGSYTIAHGAGYSRYERVSAGLAHTLTVFVPVADPVKVVSLTLRNLGRQARHLTVTGYVDWVLGTLHAQAQYFINTERDVETGALLARNTYNADYPDRVAFLYLGSAATARTRGAPALSLSGDRTAFIGRNRSLANPAALDWPTLDGRTGAGLDPCGAAQLRVEIPAGGTIEVVLLLGQTRDADEARRLIARYGQPGQAAPALAAVRAMWDELLGTVQVETPDRALNHLLNRWLLYQALVCRIWGRSAFYQSGGAYGFRDQLQDVLALSFARPALARQHLLRAAARQFSEGDVQHWWHPSTGQGVRTRFSDDYLWLPYVVGHYVQATGDTGVLDELVPFLKAPPLAADQHEGFVIATAGPTGTLYEHCQRALDHGLTFGPHGLPLMGSGDWNDGMNLVGAGGQGESIWLGWFLITNLQDFAGLAAARADDAAAARWRAAAAQVQPALEAHGWDGAWYRRAYYDDGTPLGTATAAECQIDSIAQSWAVLSGAAPTERARQAMQSLEQHLVRAADGLVLLLTPPFNISAPSPGYIQGYVPGIRENGGQYTHAALWAILAYVQQGNGDRAGALFRLINPIYHTASPAAVARYKVEPYVVAADVYSHPQHLGRGGWTWYTGSAAWMYRAGVEGLLGLQRRGNHVQVDPCIPSDWPGFRATITHGSARYAVEVRNPQHVSRGVQTITLDGQPLAGSLIPLVADGQTHQVIVTLGAA